MVSEVNETFIFDVPSDISVEKFKSIVLNKTIKPFYFDFKIDHDKKIEELLKKSENQTLNISFDQNILNL